MRRPHDRVKIVTDALHMEKQVSRELTKALQAQIIINEALRERIKELEGEK